MNHHACGWECRTGGAPSLPRLQDVLRESYMLRLHPLCADGELTLTWRELPTAVKGAERGCRDDFRNFFCQKRSGGGSFTGVIHPPSRSHLLNLGRLLHSRHLRLGAEICYSFVNPSVVRSLDKKRWAPNQFSNNPLVFL